METPATIQSAIESLLANYTELNASTCSTLDRLPTPLEFMRHVALNRPFVVRGGARSWKAAREWNAAYLLAAMREREVEVAVTPNG